jgi:DNA polymerase III subunit gamma/tau
MDNSLINKYRPQKLSEVIGHDEVKKSLQNVIKKNLAHSFIFTGLGGTGKTSIARIVSRELGCDSPVEIDAATNNSVENMRAIIEKLPYKSFGGKPKSIILDEVHRLSSAAWPSILKSVEEPPSHVYWFMCSTEPVKIPQTIKTRCQVYDLKPVDDDLIFEHLCKICELEKWSTPDEVLDLLALECQGSVRQALSYLATCYNCTTRNEAAELLNTATESKEIIDLCRLLVSDKNLTWKKVMSYVGPLKEQNSESIRISVVNYLSVVLLNSKIEDNTRLLNILSCFSTPYNQNDKLAPLLISLGGVIYN